MCAKPSLNKGTTPLKYCTRTICNTQVTNQVLSLRFKVIKQQAKSIPKPNIPDVLLEWSSGGKKTKICSQHIRQNGTC